MSDVAQQKVLFKILYLLTSYTINDIRYILIYTLARNPPISLLYTSYFFITIFQTNTSTFTSDASSGRSLSHLIVVVCYIIFNWKSLFDLNTRWFSSHHAVGTLVRETDGRTDGRTDKQTDGERERERERERACQLLILRSDDIR